MKRNIMSIIYPSFESPPQRISWTEYEVEVVNMKSHRKWWLMEKIKVGPSYSASIASDYCYQHHQHPTPWQLDSFIIDVHTILMSNRCGWTRAGPQMASSFLWDLSFKFNPIALSLSPTANRRDNERSPKWKSEITRKVSRLLTYGGRARDELARRIESERAWLWMYHRLGPPLGQGATSWRKYPY